MSGWGWGLFIVAAVTGTVIGKIAHEATHAAVAWLLGAREIQMRAFTLGHQEVRYTLTGGVWRQRIIGLAPLIIGFTVILPGWLFLQGRFSWDVVDLGFLFGWVWYTLRGGIEDFRVERAHERERQLTAEAAD